MRGVLRDEIRHVIGRCRESRDDERVRAHGDGSASLNRRTGSRPVLSVHNLNRRRYRRAALDYDVVSGSRFAGREIQRGSGAGRSGNRYRGKYRRNDIRADREGSEVDREHVGLFRAGGIFGEEVDDVVSRRGKPRNRERAISYRDRSGRLDGAGRRRTVLAEAELGCRRSGGSALDYDVVSDGIVTEADERAGRIRGDSEYAQRRGYSVVRG